MAGDWIKVEEALPDKPEVWEMASILGIDPDAVTGKLIRVWSWASRSCNADGVTHVTAKLLIDRETGVSGFSEAMQKVGWLIVKSAQLVFPNFDRHNSQTAKERALASRRVSKHRVTEMLRCERNESVTREEKRRDKKNRTGKKKSGSVFSELTGAHLDDPRALLDWANRSFPGSSGDDLARIFAAAEHSRTGESPIRLFVATVRDKAWDKCSSAERERGWKKLKAVLAGERNGRGLETISEILQPPKATE